MASTGALPQNSIPLRRRVAQGSATPDQQLNARPNAVAVRGPPAALPDIVQTAPAWAQNAQAGLTRTPVLQERQVWQSKWAACTVGALIGQHAILASATYFQFCVLSATTVPAAMLFGLLFLATYPLSQVPKNIFTIAQNRWRMDAIEAQQTSAVGRNLGRIAVWGDTNLASQVSASFAQQGPETVTTYVNTMSEGLSRTLNFAINGLMLAAMIDAWLLAAFVASAALALGTTMAATRVRRPRILHERRRIAALNEQRATYWDNTLLGTRYTNTQWRADLNARFVDWRRSSVALENVGAFITFCSAAACAAPILGLLGFRYAKLASTSLGGREIGTFMSLAPRVLFTFEHELNLVAFLPRMPAAREQLEREMSRLDAVSQLARQIRAEDITVTSQGAPLHRLSALWHTPEHFAQAGRYTFRGGNGAGKSTALQRLAHYFQERALYLPARSRLAVATSAGSDGERKEAALRYALSSANSVPILILDEWDDAMDDDRRSRCSALIAQESLRRAIIEVTHR